MIKTIIPYAVAMTTLLSSSLSYSAVSEAEAAKLGNELTPFGAMKAGNADGTIPAWNGGVTVAPRPNGDDLPQDPYADDKVLFTINSSNMAQYADKLSAGTMALLKKYPDFSLDIYPTRRSAAAPQYIYDNTKKNAVNAHLADGGKSFEGAYGGFPFPIPQSGLEVMWNHIFRPVAYSYESGISNLVGSADGSVTIASSSEAVSTQPAYNPNGSLEGWNGDYILARLVNTAPIFKVGEAMVIRDNIQKGRTAWQYLVGQRRVRRAPNVDYDTPDTVSSGANYFDEVNGFFGKPDRFDWKLVGKVEKYIPYNANSFNRTPIEEAFIAHHPNPDKLRWELHRVWQIEATVAPGQRHAVPKRTYYVDEDSWSVSLVDGYDAQDQLWRFTMTLPFIAPSVPMLVNLASCTFDFQASTYGCGSTFNDGYWHVSEPKRDSYFTGDSLASESAR